MKILLLLFLLPLPKSSSLRLRNSSLPDPESVSLSVSRHIHLSLRRSLSSSSPNQHCLSGNPIDDCLLCSSPSSPPQHLADCSIGFGRLALGGKGGPFYLVSDPSDSDPLNPSPGTLRHAAIQSSPLWITFSSPLSIHLSHELLINSFKTLDGRNSLVHISGACLTLQYVSNVILHNLHIHDCLPSPPSFLRSSPTHSGFRSRSDGDAISIFASRHIWIDHCSLSNSADGLIDAIMGSTQITISNNHFFRHNQVMLLGHSDTYSPDLSMQITIAFNRFGDALVQRMPRCRLGYFHIVNNDFRRWEMYAIGGSANPTVNSQGNRYIAPDDPNAKEVTKRVDSEEGEWSKWNWRSQGDLMLNGAFFVPSGIGLDPIYTKASSFSAKSVGFVDQLTLNAGVLGADSRDNGDQNRGDNGGGGDGGDGNTYLSMAYGSGASPPASESPLLLYLPIIFSLISQILLAVRF